MIIWIKFLLHTKPCASIPKNDRNWCLQAKLRSQKPSKRNVNDMIYLTAIG